MVTNETILLIDDRREDVERLVETILNPAGYHVVVAHDGERGLRAALAEHPALIILDVNAPQRNGLEILQELREAGEDVPVILTTYHSSARSATQAFRFRASDYIVKPYEVERMIDSIERALDTWRLRREHSPAAGAHQPPANLSTNSDVAGWLELGDQAVGGLREQVAALQDWLAHVPAVERGPDERGSVQDSAPSSSPGPRSWAMDAILRHMAEGVLIVDRAGRIRLNNRVAEAMLETPLVDRSIGEVCDDPRWIKTYQIVVAAAQVGGDEPGSGLAGATTRLAVAGKTLHASFRAGGGEGDAGGMVVLLQDTTAEREARRAKDSFVSSTSQKLRTPTTSIIGYTDLLLSESVGRLENTQHKFLDHIRDNAVKIALHLDGLTSLTGGDSSPLEPGGEPVALSGVIQEVAEAVSLRLDEKQQTLQADVDPDLPLVQADPDTVYHALVSLLLNAHRCSPEQAEIRLVAGRIDPQENGYVTLSVTDAGGGVAPEDVKKVFNRAYRFDAPHVAGLGDPEMNLPLVKVLVEAHGGRMWMESVPGTGNTFTLLLPIVEPSQDGA